MREGDYCDYQIKEHYIKSAKQLSVACNYYETGYKVVLFMRV